MNNTTANPFTLASRWVDVMDELRETSKSGDVNNASQQHIENLMAERRNIERVSAAAGIEKTVTAMIRSIRGF